MIAPIRVSMHAAERWCERVDPAASLAEAVERIQESSRAIRIAAAFGCHCLKLGCGAKLVLDGETVVTVLPRGSLGGVWRHEGVGR